MTDAKTSYEEAEDLGEVVSNGVRYRVFYDSKRGCTISVLLPGQNLVGTTIPLDQGVSVAP